MTEAKPSVPGEKPMTNDELLPCPLCSSTNLGQRFFGDRSEPGVGCNDCGCMIKDADRRNTRPSQPEPEGGLVEAARAAAAMTGEHAADMMTHVERLADALASRQSPSGEVERLRAEVTHLEVEIKSQAEKLNAQIARLEAERDDLSASVSKWIIRAGIVEARLATLRQYADNLAKVIEHTKPKLYPAHGNGWVHTISSSEICSLTTASADYRAAFPTPNVHTPERRKPK